MMNTPYRTTDYLNLYIAGASHGTNSDILTYFMWDLVRLSAANSTALHVSGFHVFADTLS